MTTAAFKLHPLEQGDPPRWASSWGHDAYGVWAGFAVGEGRERVEQRMRWIRRGDFTMGSPMDERGRFRKEGPQRWVRISRGFWLGDTPCTQALWTAVMGNNPSHFQGDASRPVERVSVPVVEGFLRALGQRVEDLAPRLPTEAQWEYACRAGHEGLTTYPLPGQSKAAAPYDVAWFRGNAAQSGRERRTHRVGLKSPNDWGLYDMLGNVYEWCADAWHAYEASERRVVDPYVAPARHALRVVRGGSWNSNVQYVRAAYRRAYVPSYAIVRVGFRLARGQ